MRNARLSSFVAALLISAAPVLAVVVPNDRELVAGGGTFLGPLSNAQRTYQLLIDDSQLTSLVGLSIAGITWRLLPSATTAFPAADITFTNYDIYLSDSVEPALRSLTFASNVVGAQTQVRSGPLTIPAGSFPVGSNPQPFGTMIAFNTPYAYSGGNLLIELRHTGFTGTSASVDSVLASGGPGNGYGVLFSACWQSSYTATSGMQANAVITNIFPVVPEPASCFIALAGLVMLRRRSSQR